MDRRDRVRWIYTSRDNEELAERYNEWARQYDEDLTDEFGWIGPLKAAEVLARFVDKRSRILDAGAGTGLVGEVLAERGYENLVALDISQGMLDEAGEKGVYRELHRMVLGEELTFATDSFDSVICVGVLTIGHAPPSALDEFIRVTKPGGYVIFTLRPDVYEEGGFQEKQDEMEKGGRWTLVEVSEKFAPMPKGEPDVFHQVWAYRVD